MTDNNNHQTDMNDEMKDLLTHQAGATDLHKTRRMNEPVQIDPPAVPTNGAIDPRTSE
ncbi:hypothetical protein [Paenibacillus sp. R14(2021)]|uniref:hypothetical protein n=1 Tax=Paenibacillus sp. R14(2021) TaxID=2859228 RepID=UPI001C614496|nr:hypothetical protein [Paenibacillus sp. R14(2021)]